MTKGLLQRSVTARIVENRRNRIARVRELDEVAKELATLRADAGIRADADGHRENRQMLQALQLERITPRATQPTKHASARRPSGTLAERMAEQYQYVNQLTGD